MESNLVALVSVLSVLMSAGCGDINKKYEEQSQIAAKGAVDANNADLAQKAARAENDLATRQRLYQSVQGKYAANPDQHFVDSDGLSYATHLEVTVNLPPYHPPRVRTEGEIAADIASLSLSAQITHTTVDAAAVTVGCTFLNAPIDLDAGRIVLKASDCPSAYVVYLAPALSQPVVDRGRIIDLSTVVSRAQHSAQEILVGKVTTVNQLVVTMRPLRAAESFNFVLNRVSP